MARLACAHIGAQSALQKQLRTLIEAKKETATPTKAK
jgi:hypothetical protein